MHNNRYQHNLTFSMIKNGANNGANKEHIRHYLLFCFHQKKSAADVHRIIWENIIAIKTCELVWTNWFKNSDFDIKERSECSYRRGWIEKRWENVVENNEKYFD